GGWGWAPPPLAGRWRTGPSAAALVERRFESAAVQKRNRMAAAALCGVDQLGDEYRRWFARDDGAEFLARARVDAIDGKLLEPDDAARHVPSRTVILIVSPREERPSPIVADEQIDADERRQPAEKQENVLREAAPRIARRRLEGLNVRSDAHRRN